MAVDKIKKLKKALAEKKQGLADWFDQHEKPDLWAKDVTPDYAEEYFMQKGELELIEAVEEMLK